MLNDRLARWLPGENNKLHSSPINMRQAQPPANGGQVGASSGSNGFGRAKQRIAQLGAAGENELPIRRDGERPLDGRQAGRVPRVARPMSLLTPPQPVVPNEVAPPESRRRLSRLFGGRALLFDCHHLAAARVARHPETQAPVAMFQFDARAVMLLRQPICKSAAAATGASETFNPFQGRRRRLARASALGATDEARRRNRDACKAPELSNCATVPAGHNRRLGRLAGRLPKQASAITMMMMIMIIFTISSPPVNPLVWH